MKNRIVSTLIIMFIIFYSSNVTVHAYGWLDDKPIGTNVFDTLEKEVEKTTASAYTVSRNLSLIILSIGLLLISLRITSKNAKLREETKEQLSRFLIGAIIIFGVLAFATIAITIGKSIK